MEISDFNDIWKRIKNNTGLKSQNDLAGFLGITQPSVAKAKKRQRFPYDWIIKIASEHNLSLKWLLTGEGEIRENDLKEKNGSYHAKNGLVTVGNNNSINIHVEKRQGKDYSPDFMRLATEIICSEDEEMIRLAIAQLSAIAQLIAQKKRGS